MTALKFFLTLFISFLIAALIAPYIIETLRKLACRQMVRAEGPKNHLDKTGTPTMGGVIIIVSIIITLLFSAIFFNKNIITLNILIVLLMTLGHAALGLVDDWLMVLKKRSLGLRARDKLFWQTIMGFLLAVYVVYFTPEGSWIFVPYIGKFYLGPVLSLLFITFVVVGTTNAVNLTDGLDGLAAGTVTISLFGFSIIAGIIGKQDLAFFSVIAMGACMGFLWFNAYPARIFMGDTGSLALGGALAAIAILSRRELWLGVMGGIFIVEALSVIIQVISFKTTGKRVFKMSPLHHHFELQGWAESTVTTRFWIINTFLVGLGLVLIYLRD